MKTTLFLTFCVMMMFFACKKDNDTNEVVEAIKKEDLTRKINDIIPKQYQDTLAKLGIVLNQEVEPPNLEGAFGIKPLRLLKSNRLQDPANMAFNDVSVKFFTQDKDNNIKLIGKNFVGNADTSIVTAISGKGMILLFYGKVKAVQGSNLAIFGIVISGVKDGDLLRNVRYGIINIDNSKGGTVFIKQGDARAVFDTDLISGVFRCFNVLAKNILKGDACDVKRHSGVKKIRVNVFKK